MSEILNDNEVLARGDIRITVHTIEYGQSRPYGDTVNHKRIMFEFVPYFHEDGEERVFKPSLDALAAESRVRERLKGLDVGFVEFQYPPEGRVPTETDYFRTRLEFLKMVAPGIWEFKTIQKYTG